LFDGDLIQKRHPPKTSVDLVEIYMTTPYLRLFFLESIESFYEQGN